MRCVSTDPHMEQVFIKSGPPSKPSLALLPLELVQIPGGMFKDLHSLTAVHLPHFLTFPLKPLLQPCSTLSQQHRLSAPPFMLL